jgi:predicted Zn-dependent protease
MSRVCVSTRPTTGGALARVVGIALVVTVVSVVAAWLPAAVASDQAVVTAESATVHAQASDGSTVVGSLARGAQVTIGMTLRGPDGDWCQVTATAPSRAGFVRCAALDRVPTAATPDPPATVTVPQPSTPANAAAKRGLRGTGELYLLPVGPLGFVSLSHLVSYYQAKFGLDIAVLPAIDVDDSVKNFRRRQLVAERVLDAIRGAAADVLQRPSAVVIGITEYDMYTTGRRDWAFAFSTRASRVAFVSAARMNPLNLGARPDNELLHARLRKMITKNLGVLYFGLLQSPDPTSVMFDNVLSVDDLDRMGEDLR